MPASQSCAIRGIRVHVCSDGNEGGAGGPSLRWWVCNIDVRRPAVGSVGVGAVGAVAGEGLLGAVVSGACGAMPGMLGHGGPYLGWVL